jgi:hypothetical protein
MLGMRGSIRRGFRLPHADDFMLFGDSLSVVIFLHGY